MLPITHLPTKKGNFSSRQTQTSSSLKTLSDERLKLVPLSGLQDILKGYFSKMELNTKEVMVSVDEVVEEGREVILATVLYFI